MAAYSYGQLESLWIRAGGSRALAPLMAAIALAESGGNPASNNYTDNGGTQTSWGLWQVSDGTHSWPGPQDPNDPMNNARYAVAKYASQGLRAWGTYDSGAYKQFYQGNVQPSSLPQGGNAAGTSGDGQPTTQMATEDAWWSGPGGLFNLPGDIVNGIDSLVKGAGGIAGTGDALKQIARGFTLLLKAFEWFFVPSHWVRMIAAGFGLLFLIPGLYALMKASAGGSGDVTLALAILFVTLAGICFFIAFHNVPTDIQNLSGLLGWITSEIRKGSAAPATEAQLQ